VTTDSRTTLLVDGAWAAADDGRTFDVVDPSSGVVIGRASDAGPHETVRAIEAATKAFAEWRSTSPYARAEVLHRAHRLMTERNEQLARLMSHEQGKPLQAARNEVRYAADFLSWFAEESKRIYGSTIPSARGSQRFTVLRQPVGVVAAITPWNYPISMITRKVAPALAAGCTVVLKPAEQTPFCAKAVFEILVEAGAPAGVVNLITTSRPADVGEAMMSSTAVRKLTFTGSTAVGKLLAARAAETIKNVSLELGGHAPFLVFEDADPKRAATGASLVKFLNTGQACICPNRMYVHESLVPAFEEALTTRVSKMVPGPGLEETSTIGPLIDQASMEKVARHVTDAVDKGARLLHGGQRLNGDLAAGNFYAPTILGDVTPDMQIYREETFGPVAAIIPFRTESEAIEMANDTEYGLASYVYTSDLDRAVRVTEALDFAIVGLNDINPTSASVPFGGMGESGLGREGGPHGIDEYLETKVIGHLVGS
jgi:succinate-semialdehyde dehydrogenase/glutarate-semialdehyde dehydrogenase